MFVSSIEMRWRPLWVRFTLSAAFFLRLLLPLRSLLGCVVGEGDVVGVVSFSPSSSSSMPPCSCCACESSCAAFSFFLVSFNCARTSSTSSRAFATEASSAFFSSPQLSLALLSSSRSLSLLRSTSAACSTLRRVNTASCSLSALNSRSLFAVSSLSAASSSTALAHLTSASASRFFTSSNSSTILLFCSRRPCNASSTSEDLSLSLPAAESCAR